MNSFLRLSAFPLAVACCTTLVLTQMPAAQAAAGAKEDWCLASGSSAVKTCGFASLEQCRATKDGIGGSCYRASSSSAASNAHAAASLKN
ncbi:DUF3551 domain-containing protein [Bradyrhizobium sp. 15]|uniref:DUF3551 domain-containing protein n=1 Tax=Bradyrhizobium sp. 15 TaxID=2782633 RepID=UPI001FFAEB38|nr:DUF3551 domain-containing protein [Bradyrhizobium sp. 15]MCK1439759.1 hypothetical protein [Bradyrhizobium sp. 15]